MLDKLAIILLLFTDSVNSQADSSCFTNPSQSKCKDISPIYNKQNVNTDLNSLCKMMPYMSGCLIKDACSTTPAGASGTACEPWTLLADICSPHGGASMKDMMGCHKYAQLCLNTSTSTAVEQCSVSVTSSLVLYKDARTDTITMCGSMGNMDGCSDCKTTETCARPLESLSKVCMKMDMGKCKQWNKMCAGASSSSSSSSSSTLPKFCDNQFNKTASDCSAGSMSMVFHGGIHDMVLFKDWYACNAGQYIFILVVVFLVATCSNAFRSQRKTLENGIYKSCCQSCSQKSTSSMNLPLLSTSTSTSTYSVIVGIDGMTCGSCTKTVKTALNNSVEVMSATVLLQDDGSATIVFNCSQPELINDKIDSIVENIEDVGFDVRSRSNPKPIVWNNNNNNNNSSNPYPKNAVKALIVGMQITVDYALMLAAMTFNTGVFFAVVLGFSMGTFLFSHLGKGVEINPDKDDLPACCNN